MKAAPITLDEQKAMAFSVERHGAQAYGKVPHVVHCAEVRRIVAAYGFDDPFFRVTPWLHDLVEDTETTWEEIADRFGADVAGGVWAVSGMPKGAPRRVRVADAYQKIALFGQRAGYLKLADRIANARASRASLLATPSDPGLFNMYRGELPAFEAMLDRSGAILSIMRAELRELLTPPTEEAEIATLQAECTVLAERVVFYGEADVPEAVKRIQDICARIGALTGSKR